MIGFPIAPPPHKTKKPARKGRLFGSSFANPITTRAQSEIPQRFPGEFFIGKAIGFPLDLLAAGAPSRAGCNPALLSGATITQKHKTPDDLLDHRGSWLKGLAYLGSAGCPILPKSCPVACFTHTNHPRSGRVLSIPEIWR